MSRLHPGRVSYIPKAFTYQLFLFLSTFRIVPPDKVLHFFIHHLFTIVVLSTFFSEWAKKSLLIQIFQNSKPSLIVLYAVCIAHVSTKVLKLFKHLGNLCKFQSSPVI